MGKKAAVTPKQKVDPKWAEGVKKSHKKNASAPESKTTSAEELTKLVEAALFEDDQVLVHSLLQQETPVEKARGTANHADTEPAQSERELRPSPFSPTLARADIDSATCSFHATSEEAAWMNVLLPVNVRVEEVSSAAPLGSSEERKGGNDKIVLQPAETFGRLGPDLAGRVAMERLVVFEAFSTEEKDAACDLHLSKNTFHGEKELVRLRIYKNHSFNCRTFLLAANPPCVLQDQRGHSMTSYLAAITSYKEKLGCWGQVLNMSTRRERHGFGTLLLAGTEELLRSYSTDFVVLYPADNGRAPPFWSSVGFTHRGDTSLLPKEELVSYEAGGPLLPEVDLGTGCELPRWEKEIGCGWQPGANPRAEFPPIAQASVFKGKGDGKGATRGRKKPYDPASSPQSAEPAVGRLHSATRVCACALEFFYEELLEQRVRWKAR